MAKKKAKAAKPVAKKKPAAAKPEPLVAFVPMLHHGVYVEIGEPIPKDLNPKKGKGRNFAPANIAGNMRARRIYFLKLDARKP
jgi:hypothetical protein